MAGNFFAPFHGPEGFLVRSIKLLFRTLPPHENFILEFFRQKLKLNISKPKK